jgi:eukaryotic-like serine/threonine-protein kinase
VTDGSFAQGLVGVTLDERYRLDAVLGEGGMGSVFRATHLAMDRKVAVKLLKPHLTSDQAALQRFAREARATRKVDSPHAVKILDFGVTPVGDYYMVLEYLDGRTVHRELEIDGPFAPARVVHIARQALHALGVAHGHGLIHRDVKPDNLLLMRAGADPDYTKVLDFGVAKLMQGMSDPSQLALTAQGMVFGTPEFMSPEQACGHALDGRSDLYSLAATMFSMLTGAALFEGKTAIELLTHHARTPAPRLAMLRPELAAYPELDNVLQRCLAKHREQRPGSAAEMARMLERVALAGGGNTVGAQPLGMAPTPPQAFHPSSFVSALKDTDPAPAGAVPPGPSTSSELRLLRAVGGSRRRLYVWLAGVAIASVIGVGIGVAVDRSTSRSASAREPVAGAASGAATRAAADRPPVNSGPAAGAPASDRPTSDRPTSDRPASDPPVVAASPVAIGAPVQAKAAAAVRPTAGPAPTAQAAPTASSAAAEHLRSAEIALRAGNHLKQVAEAHLALIADPRSARARYLLGDALIKSGDLDRGCAYLHELTRNRAARARARAAGCAGD